MRVAAPPLLPIFRSRTQADLLALMFTHDEQEWTIAELSERVGAPYQTVVKEVRRLAESELLSLRDVGRSKLVSANTESPYAVPLRQLVLMSFGPPHVVAEEFGGLAGAHEVMIFGSWAARYEGVAGAVPNDVDVLIVGSVDRDEAYDAAVRAEGRLGRDVNVTIRSDEQWADVTDGFIRQVRDGHLVQVA